jgi:hypothetical protein
MDHLMDERWNIMDFLPFSYRKLVSISAKSWKGKMQVWERISL